MLAHFSGGQLLAPWQHGTELDDAVFRIAATFPMRTVHHRVYMVEGDEMFGFDPNAFVQRLIEETGVPHIWEPISTRIHERGLLFRFTRVARRDEARSEPRSSWTNAKQGFKPEKCFGIVGTSITTCSRLNWAQRCTHNRWPGGLPTLCLTTLISLSSS